MVHTSTAHEVLAVVFQVRHFDQAQTPELAVLLWQRALDPHRGAWA
ncbi:NUDIX hydrolase, partial [Mycobacteroides abscessus subsp. massiliense]